MHYAVKDIAVRCTAHNLDQYQQCEFARTDYEGRCLYKQLDDTCESPEALGELTDEHQNKSVA